MELSVRFAGVVLAAVFCVGVAFGQEEKPKADPALENVDPALLPQGNTRFVVNLYRQLSATKGNLFFSPYSISEAMAMTYLGAGGETKNEMRGVLDIPTAHKETIKRLVSWSDAELAAAYKDLHGKLTGQGEKFELHIANALWGYKGAEFKPAFINTVGKEFGGWLEQVDFAKPADAAKTINDWVAKQTKDKIKDLVPADALDANVKLVLTNAIYFKAAWMHQFKPAMTEAAFHLDVKKTVDAQMMEQTERFRYGEVEGAKVLEMPYKNGAMTIVVLLPDKADGLAELEGKLTAKILADKPDATTLTPYLDSLKGERVRVKLPKFKFESRFSLADTLKAMGMKLAFDPDKADFSGMTDQEKLFIFAVLHKAFVDVNEEGTEAAAATAVAMAAKNGHSGQPKEFIADHPFIFLIRDTATGSLLFMGRVADPTK